MEADASQSHAGKKINSYSTEFNLEAIWFAVECNSNHKAAKKFNVDWKRIREWRANQSKLESASCKRKRLDRAGRRPFDLDIEKVLLEWVHEQCSNGFCVSRKMIRIKARFLHEEKCKEMELPPTFTASIGWVQKFMIRHGLCIQRKTTESQKDPKNLIDKLIAYVLQARRLRVKFSYSDSDVISVDETAVWQDMLSNTTVDSIGHNTIAMKTTGQEKRRFQFA